MLRVLKYRRPRTNLDDPGAGLRGRGWRVLTLADLRTPGGDPDPREPERDIELHLTGNMERFIWSLDGIKLNDSRPLHFKPNERLRVTGTVTNLFDQAPVFDPTYASYPYYDISWFDGVGRAFALQLTWKTGGRPL